MYTHAFEPERLLPDLIGRVREDFPNRHPAQRICPQCADLYRRPLSASAAALLPKTA